MRTTAFVAGTVSSLLLTVALGLATWIVLPTLVLGWHPTLVTSGSMEPVVSPGDVVVLRDAGTAGLDVGTVVLYDLPGTGRVLHRVVAVQDDGTYVVQGDANPAPDAAPVRPDQVRGAAVLEVPFIGLPSLWVERGDTTSLALAAALLVTTVWLAPKANDPELDPWNRQDHRLPGEILLAGRTRTSTSAGGSLVPAALTVDLARRLDAARAATTTPEGLT
ncbi:signal peptidase I [Klenkia brasiliensis]|uniref:signal peptidase I n=1 Tax=Klenkia brasiliensis TaxID=333142 RepID=UPI0013F66CCF|nr:signal peptidase I [Klenkia brasiliensis]